MKGVDVHVLVFDGKAIATASRWERLSEETSRYTAAEQKLMVISEPPHLDED